LITPADYAQPWPETWASCSIIVLEMCPILLSLATWSDDLRNKLLHIYTDNEGLVTALNKQTAKDKTLMALIRRAVLLLLRLNARIIATHIQGKHNSCADALSRNRVNVFQKLFPGCDPEPSQVPEAW
jgi:hypothetical protein